MIGPVLDFPDRCLPDLIADHAARRPDAVAVLAGEDRLSYAELVGRAAALAEILRGRGIGVDDLVGVAVDRRAPLVVALLGVLAAGAGYVPLDPALPQERLKAMAVEARLTTVVGTGPNEWADVVAVPGNVVPYRPSPARGGSTAYAMFTSGSTGRPKGVVIEHRALTEIVTAVAAFAGLDPASRCLAFSSIGFDASIVDLLAPLAAGATVVLAGDAERADPARLHRLAARHRVDVVVLPPPVLPVVDPAQLPDLRLVITGGEAPGPDQVARWTGGGRRFINVYGPTETTVLVTWCELFGSWSRPVPIGAPAANHRVYLVDPRLREVPDGEAGEVLAGGPGTGRGYLHDPAGTAARFVPDPFSGIPGARLYRTGDLARRTGEGNLEFLGRLDRQVKVRGQRIELAEIEAVLRGHPLVANAVVEARPGPELVAYAATGLSPAELREHCAASLPPAFIPARFHVRAELPATPNGKVDLDRLRAEAVDATTVELSTDGPPVSATESIVAQAWAVLLDRPAPDRSADFFDHGGHSITAMRLVTELRARLGREVAIEDVLLGRTLSGIADRAGAAAPIGPDAAVRGRPPALSPAQQRLWFLDRYSPAAGSAYNVALAERLRGPLDRAALATALAAVAARQQVLRWRIPDADGVPYAVVDPPGPVPLPVLELPAGNISASPGRSTSAADLAGWLAAGAARPFRLATDTLWRAELIQLGPADQVLAVYAHHAVFDGWSQALFYDDLAVAYDAARGAGPELAALPATYGDYVAWRADRSARRGADDLAWWLDHLTGVPVRLDLPTDRTRPAEQTFTSATVTDRFDAESTTRLGRLAAGLGATASAVLLAAFAVVLAGQSGLDDLVVGTPTVDRRAADFEPMVGFFIDIAPLRLTTVPGASFADQVRAARDELLAALAHPEAPLERVVSGFGLGGQLDRNPLVQVLFNMYTFTEPELRLSGVDSEPVPVAAPGSPFELTLYGVARDGQLRIEIVYNPDVYGADRMSTVLSEVRRVVLAGIADPDRPADPAGRPPAGQVERARVVRPGTGIVDRPATPTERAIAAVWCEVLGRVEVGATDSFFDAGGGSLSIVVVQRQLNRRLGTQLRVVDLFRYPTVRALAGHVEAGTGATAEQDAAVARAASRGAARRDRAGRRSMGRDADRGSEL